MFHYIETLETEVRKVGQYFIIVNLDKKELIHPHKMGSGMKLLEISFSEITRIFPILLRKSNGNGGGDIDTNTFKSAGRWSGDKIVVIGDYDKSKLFNKAVKKFNDISLEVREDLKGLIQFEERWDKGEIEN